MATFKLNENVIRILRKLSLDLIEYKATENNLHTLVALFNGIQELPEAPQFRIDVKWIQNRIEYSSSVGRDYIELYSGLLETEDPYFNQKPNIFINQFRYYSNQFYSNIEKGAFITFAIQLQRTLQEAPDIWINHYTAEESRLFMD